MDHMMERRTVWFASSACAALAMLACSSGAPPRPTDPAAARAEPKGSALETWSEEETEVAAAPEESVTAQPAAEDPMPAAAAEPEVRLSPIDALTERGVVFMI